jgi:hypothetical protein
MKKALEINFKIRVDYDIKGKEFSNNLNELEQEFFKKVGIIMKERCTVLGRMIKVTKEEDSIDVFWETKLIK